MKKTSTRLADGRELLYYDSRDDAVRDAVDRRPLEPISTTSEVRRDPLLGDSVAIASHRQGRTYHPPADECPLCPSRDGRLSEIPAADYAAAIGRLVREPGLRDSMGRAAVEHARGFAWEHTADQTLDVYRKAAVALWRNHPSTRQEALGG